MQTVTKGQITITAVSSKPSIQVWIEANGSTTQVANNGAESFVPSWTLSSPLVLTPVVMISGNSSNQVNVVGRIKNVSWTVGGESINSSNYSDNFGAKYDASANGGYKLSIAKNLYQTPSANVEFNAVYVHDDKSETNIHGQININRIVNGTESLACIIETGSTGNAFNDNDDVVTLTAHGYVGTVDTCVDLGFTWYHRGDTGWEQISSTVSGLIELDDAYDAHGNEGSGNVLRIYKDFIDSSDVFKCEVNDNDPSSSTYGHTAVAYMPVKDYTDPFDLAITTGSTSVTNENKITQLNAVLTQGGRAVLDQDDLIEQYTWSAVKPIHYVYENGDEEDVDENFGEWATRMYAAGKINKKQVEVSYDDLAGANVSRATFFCTATLK